jgi:hypothetical protein
MVWKLDRGMGAGTFFIGGLNVEMPEEMHP